MKRFFSAFLGSMAALWFSAALVAGGFFVFLFIIIAAADDTGQLKKHSVLHLDLSGEITDRENIPAIEEIIYGGVEKTQSFEEITDALRLAADDKNIEGLYIECNGSAMGFALRQELQQAIQNFKKSKKWVIAYGDSYSQGDYYLATAADSVFVNPVGSVDIRGLAVQTPYFKDALDKLGIEMQIIKVGTFKSAVEPFILQQPSEPSQLQTHVFLDAIWGNIAGTMAKNRKVTAARVNMWADSLIAAKSGQPLVDQHVVDALKYRREVEDVLRNKTGIDEDDDLRLVTPKKYMAFKKTADASDLSALLDKNKKHIAVYYATGDIVDNGKEGISGELMVPEIISLADDDDVAGLVLRVNSGGGSAFASEQIWEALEYFKNSGKPFYVSMADYAASGGYYISCGADRIFADNNTITGSIGIFGMIPCAKQLMNRHLGINISTIQTNPNGDMGSLAVPLTPDQHAALQSMVEEGYALFTGRVAQGRDLPIDSVLAIAEGRVWDGSTALEIGLVDQIGSLEVAIKAMAKKVGLKPTDLRSYPNRELSPLEEILLNSDSFKGAAATDARTLLGLDGLSNADARRCLRFVRQVNRMQPVQARMPYLIVR